jgi:hypothetical protein
MLTKRSRAVVVLPLDIHRDGTANSCESVPGTTPGNQPCGAKCETKLANVMPAAVQQASLAIKCIGDQSASCRWLCRR